MSVRGIKVTRLSCVFELQWVNLENLLMVEELTNLQLFPISTDFINYLFT